MKIELRSATTADLQLVYDVTEAAMRVYVEQAFGPWEPDFQRDLIVKSFNPSAHHIILSDGSVAGVFAASEHDTHVQLEKLYLLPIFQRMGIGSYLIKQMVQSVGITKKPVRLRVLAVNTSARRFYERCGFVVSGVTPERVFMEYNA